MEKLFAVTAPGLEPFTARELHELELVPESTQPTTNDVHPGFESDGGVAFSGDLAALYRANLHLRTASRILVRLGEFDAVGFSELRKRASRLEWHRFLKPNQPVAIRVTSRKSRLYHSDAVAERVAGAINDRLGGAVSVCKAQTQPDGRLPQLIVVRLLHDHCSISIDSSGELLHRRGYRLETAKAPLRETLAAAMLLASAWDGSSPLLDPFCGSGTIAIEAALLAGNLAPGRARRFAFMDWPGFKNVVWKNLLVQSDQQSRPREVSQIVIQASDRDAGAIEIARANAARAGVADQIVFSCRAVSAIEPLSGRGWVATNPPYGLRVRSAKDLRDLYAQFGNVLRAKCPGWQVAVLCNDLALLGQTRLRLDTSLAMVNGGVAVRLGRGKVGD